MIRLVPMQPFEVDTRWDEIEPGLSRALKYMERLMNADDVRRLLHENMLKMLQIYEDSEPIGYVTLEKINYPRGRMLRVVSLQGERLDIWFEELVRQIRRAAVMLGADGVEAAVRPGMAKMFKRLGYDTSLTWVSAYG